ncbi:hypothetical protein D3C71_1469870 [compost metagenome]
MKDRDDLFEGMLLDEPDAGQSFPPGIPAEANVQISNRFVKSIFRRSAPGLRSSTPRRVYPIRRALRVYPDDSAWSIGNSAQFLFFKHGKFSINAVGEHDFAAVRGVLEGKSDRADAFQPVQPVDEPGFEPRLCDHEEIEIGVGVKAFQLHADRSHAKQGQGFSRLLQACSDCVKPCQQFSCIHSHSSL